jgi:hypothetical protein
MAMLTRSDVGRPMTWSIMQDKWPARVLSAPQIDSSQGQPRQMVEVIVFRPTRDGGEGSEYLSTRLVGANFLQRRQERVEALDGPPGSPKSLETLNEEAEAAFATYQAEQGTTSNISLLEAELAE